MTKSHLIIVLIVGNVVPAILFPIAPMTIISTFQGAPWWGKIVITLVMIGAVAFEIFLVFASGLLQIPASKGAAYVDRITTGRTTKVYELEDVIDDIRLQGEQNGKNN